MLEDKEEEGNRYEKKAKRGRLEVLCPTSDETDPPGDETDPLADETDPLARLQACLKDIKDWMTSNFLLLN